MPIRTLQNIREIVHESVRIFVHARCFFSGAALAFFALLSLIPFFILSASVLGFILSEVDPAEATRMVADFTERYLPFLRGELELRLLELVAARNITGVIGILVLITTAAFFFLTVEQAMAEVFSQSAGGSYWRGKGQALALIPGAVALVGLLHYTFLVVDTVIGFASVPGLERLIGSAVIDWIVSSLLLAVEFSLVIYWFEGTRIRFRNVLSGAVVFCALWSLARVAFSFYVQRITDLSIVYGSLGSLIALMIWVHYVALVFLMACCVTEALRRRQPDPNGASHALDRPDP